MWPNQRENSDCVAPSRQVDREVIWRIQIANGRMGSKRVSGHSRIPASHGTMPTCLDSVANTSTVKDGLHRRLDVQV
jgi:hypothetical protein